MNRSLRTIGNVFAEIQDAGTVNNKIVYTLIDEFVESPNNFLRGMEQCYLKICKMGTRANKKPIEKFEKITEKFFQLFSQEAHRHKGKKSKIEQDDVYGVLQHLLNFLTQGLEAPNIIVRQICAKHISIMLKVFSNEDFEAILDANVINNLNEGNVSLLRSKQPSLKLLGLKIASYIQKFESDEVQQEVVNIATNEESRDIRKVAIINLRVNESTLPALLTRTRDVDSELRILVYKKLMKHKVHLIKLKLSDIYKVVYDGLFAREEGVRDQCTAYLREVYNLFEAPEAGGSEKKSSEKAGEAKETYSKVKLSILRFLKIFQIKKVLTHPHIYDLMEAVVFQLIKAIIPTEKLETYLREFIRVDFKQQKLLNAHPEEIFFVRVVSQYVTKHSTELPSLSALIDDLFPSLAELSKIIDKSYGKKDLLSTYQTLLMAEPLLNSDETGRQAIIASLRKILLDINSKIPLNDDEEFREEYNDVFPKKTELSLLLESYAQSFLDTPVIQSADDLTPIVVRILRKLLDDKNNAFSTLLLETISVIREPIEKGQDQDNSELNEERKRLMKHIEHYDNALKGIDEELHNAKKAKKNKAAIEHIEHEKSKTQSERENYVSKLNDIDNRKSKIDIRCLHIACSLLEGCKLSLTDPGIMGLLGSFIGPCFQEKNAFVKDLSFKCLSLYLLLDKRTCSDYMKIYKNIIDENSEEGESIPSLLTAIKACFDFFLIFKFGVEEDVNFENDDEGQFEPQDIIESLISLMFRGDISAKKICVEGFCKLLFNNKVKNPVQLLSLLMLIWINPQQTLNEGTKIVQTLSMFYKAYTPYSYSCLKNSEQAIEIFIELLHSVSESREFDFNSDLFSLEMNEDYFNMILRTALSLMKKEEYKFSNLDEDQDRISPSERLFIFLALLASDKEKAGKPYKKVFAKNLNQFDFEFLPAFNRRLLVRFLHELAEEKDGAPFKEFLKKLEGREEEGEKDVQVDEDELIQTDKQIVEDIKKCRQEAKQLTKNLISYQVLVKTEKRKPHKEATEAANHEDKENKDSQVHPKPRGRPPKSKAAANAEKKAQDRIEEEKESVHDSENDDEEEENSRTKKKKTEADGTKKQQARGTRSKRNAPTKNYKEEEEEDEDGEGEKESEDEDEEEEPQKKTRQTKTKKKDGVKAEESENDDKEEESGEEEGENEGSDEEEEESEAEDKTLRKSPRNKGPKSREGSSSKKDAAKGKNAPKGKSTKGNTKKRKQPAKGESDESEEDQDLKKSNKRVRKAAKGATKKKK